MRRTLAALAALVAAVPLLSQPAGRENFNRGWTFCKDGKQRPVDLPHDWGVEGPFVLTYPGETGKLAWWGEASYRKGLTLSEEDLSGTHFRLEVDGAMSDSQVWVNGQQVGGRPYGYASYAADLTPALHAGENAIEITVRNPENSSRWYPGGGVYRNVWLTRTPRTAVAHWGTWMQTRIATPYRTADTARADAHLHLAVTLRTDAPTVGVVTTRILYREVSPRRVVEHVLAETRNIEEIYDNRTIHQTFDVPGMVLWEPSHPFLYVARTVVETPDGTRDTYETPFGVRQTEWRPDGFWLNGERTFLKGVCVHHDAGALGAVWNDDAWVRRLTLLRRMGCNALRMSHNPPAPELLDLCDRMGFLVMDELTDTWTYAKKPNGYARLFDEWAERDLTDLIRRDRNHPSVILWSIGNECGEQGDSTRWWIPQMLTDICHREDPTRPTTAGNDNVAAAFTGYAATMDVYGFNYKPHAYKDFRDSHPGVPFLGSETASTVSTRGYYLFPVSDDKAGGWLDFAAPYQVSSYDLYAPAWASSPDYEWAYEDAVPACAGEFVWTGFDYLGEPTPYNSDPTILTNFHDPDERARMEAQLRQWGMTMDAVPSRSSYFGILDLAGFPKDRYWLYQARWRPELPMAHILPHWTWPGREGQVTPVHVYTSGDEAELFVNGISQGRRPREGYRVVWPSVVYVPGTVRVVAYRNGLPWAEDEVRTAGKARSLRLRVDYAGEDLVYVAAEVVDRQGVPVPDAADLLTFQVKGDGLLHRTDAGDPTSQLSFQSPSLPAFHGLASAVIRRTGKGPVTVSVSAKGLRGARLTLAP